MRAFHYSPKFRRWLRSLDPREELIARMALRDDIREPSANREWNARIDQLQREIIKTEADWAELLPPGATGEARDPRWCQTVTASVRRG
jgi:hypothetical protein